MTITGHTEKTIANSTKQDDLKIRKKTNKGKIDSSEIKRGVKL